MNIYEEVRTTLVSTGTADASGKLEHSADHHAGNRHIVYSSRRRMRRVHSKAPSATFNLTIDTAPPPASRC